MTDPAAIIAAIEAEHDRHTGTIAGLLAELRAAVAGDPATPDAEPIDDQIEERRKLTVADFPGEELIALTNAAALYGIDKPTLARWCRDHGCGYKRGGRWLISVPRLRARIGLP